MTSFGEGSWYYFYVRDTMDRYCPDSTQMVFSNTGQDDFVRSNGKHGCRHRKVRPHIRVEFSRNPGSPCLPLSDLDIFGIGGHRYCGHFLVGAPIVYLLPGPTPRA